MPEPTRIQTLDQPLIVTSPAGSTEVQNGISTVPPAGPAGGGTLDQQPPGGDFGTAVQTSTAVTPSDGRPARRFVLGSEIARGGMGEVYHARDTHLNRDVAVKTLKRELAGTMAERRFHEEAEITGQLQHPGIPPVYDLGTLPDGRPYLAMKLIRGRTLEALLERDGPGGRWLPAFEALCQATAYAHAHGVIHRDLKPLNVMVGAFGEVQVMDWGLARLVADHAAVDAPPAATVGPQGDTQTAVHVEPPAAGRPPDNRTLAGQAMGTPSYMPPEQARGEWGLVDRRSDVFGLGAVLCALLTGRPPFTASEFGSALQAAKAGRLGPALDRLTGCGADPGVLALCRRCLAPVPADRPADAGAVAAEVAALRQAADERARQAEVAAGQSLVREAEGRKRRRVLTVGSLALAVAAGVSGWLAVRATAAERETDKQLALTQTAEATARTERDAAVAAKATAVEEGQKARQAEIVAVQRQKEEKLARESVEASAGFMKEVFAQGSAHGQARPDRTVNPKITLKAAMDYAAKNISGRFTGRPDLEAEVRSTIGLAYGELGAMPEAVDMVEKALALRRRTLGHDHLLTQSSVNDLASLHFDQGNHAQAEPLMREALATNTRTLGPTHPETILCGCNLGCVLASQGKAAEAEPYLRTGTEYYRKTLGPMHTITLAMVNNLADVYLKLDRPAEAVILFQEVVDGFTRLHGPEHPATLTAVNNLGQAYAECKQPVTAAPLFERALAGRRKVLGDNHPDTLDSVGALAIARFNLKQYAEALPLTEEEYAALCKQTFAGNEVLLARCRLGLCLVGVGRHADAEPHLLAGCEALSKRTQRSGFEQLRLRQMLAGLATAADTTGDREAAARWRAEIAKYPEVAPKPRPAGGHP